MRNKESVRDAIYTVSYIWHAAALKQVPSCEFFPMEAVRTNVIGTDNVLHAAMDAGVERVVCLSTDKAAYPINAMGTSKAMMEHVIRGNARVSAERGGPVICCTRYGNVMCSRGSVIPLFIDQIKAGNPITITNPDMTRFLMDLDEAVELVKFAFVNAEPGDLFVQKADASTIGDLAKGVQRLFGDSGTKIIGNRHGEKMSETLLTREERINSIDMGDYFRVPMDTRGLNYDKYFIEGIVITEADGAYTSSNTREELGRFCREADFVVHAAGVNRPKEQSEFMEGNFGFTSELLDTLKRCGSKAPILITSSVQATLSGRFGDSAYGRSKLAGEELLFRYGEETGAPVYIYRFENMVDKWIRPRYNSAVATFCHCIARGEPITVNDPGVLMEMVFFDDICEEIYDAMEGHPHRCRYEGAEAVPDEAGRYCHCPVKHRATLGRIVELLHQFHDFPRDFVIRSLAPPAPPWRRC